MLEQMIKEAVGQMDGNFYVIEHGKMAVFNERCEYCDSMKQYYEMLEILKNKKPIDLYEEYEDVVGDLENLRYEESSIRFFMQQAFRWHKGEGIG